MSWQIFSKTEFLHTVRITILNDLAKKLQNYIQ